MHLNAKNSPPVAQKQLSRTSHEAPYAEQAEIQRSHLCLTCHSVYVSVLN